MRIEDNKLIIDEELNDEMLNSFIKKINKKSVEIIELNTDNISALALQQLFCISKDKKLICNNSFISKFFENVNIIR